MIGTTIAENGTWSLVTQSIGTENGIYTAYPGAEFNYFLGGKPDVVGSGETIIFATQESAFEAVGMKFIAVNQDLSTFPSRPARQLFIKT